VQPGQVIAGSGGQWVRRRIADPGWCAQAAWVIDPATGSDLASGAPGDPLATWGEFSARTNEGIWTVSPSISIIGDLDENITGSWVLDERTITVAGPTPPALAAGIISTFSNSVPASQAKVTLTDTGANFAGVAGKQLLITSGAAAGGRAWIADIPSSTSLSLCSRPMRNGAAVTPAPGDAYEILGDLVRVKGLSVATNGSGLAPPAVGQALMRVNSLWIGKNVLGVPTDARSQISLAGSVPLCVVEGCKLSVSFLQSARSQANRNGFVNCFVDSEVLPIMGDVSWVGGGGIAAIAVQFGGRMTIATEQALWQAPSSWVVFGDLRASVSVGVFSSSNATAALALRDQGRVVLSGAAQLFGNGNTGFGIEVPGGCFMSYGTVKPNITGAAGDSRIGGVVTAYADVPVFNTAKACGIVAL
jgi:hypothetical protein